jgi:branched-chain amino acid transport system substrate-binding protein
VRSPAIIASVGTLSGPAGATVGTVTLGGQLWAKWINQRGGLNGHAVRLIVYDDGGDPARHRSQVQEAVEQRRAIAFLAEASGFTGAGSAEYITSKRVPVIGNEGANQYWYSSPMYFPQASVGNEMIFSGMAGPAQMLVPVGKAKLATLVCAEAQACADADRVWGDSAQSVGFDHVYRAQASLATPDFTAVCLAARNAGAQVILTAMDSSSVGRIAASCARQSYHPVMTTFGVVILDRMKDDPNLADMVASSTVFPYFQSGTPASDEFQEAMRNLGNGLLPGIGVAQGWVAGKLLEKAGANLAEPPTSQSLLKGLWSIKDDTLGGLTLPHTFVENQPAKPQACWFNLRILNQAWVSPDGFKLNCRT